MEEIKESFSPEAVAILSNSVGSSDDAKYEGAQNTERLMQIPVIRHEKKKPACLDEASLRLRNLVLNIIGLTLVAFKIYLSGFDAF